MSLSLKLKNLREKHGFSQKELAEKASIPQSTIGHIEANNRIPRVDTLQKIANALGIGISDLLEGVDLLI